MYKVVLGTEVHAVLAKLAVLFVPGSDWYIPSYHAYSMHALNLIKESLDSLEQQYVHPWDFSRSVNGVGLATSLCLSYGTVFCIW